MRCNHCGSMMLHILTDVPDGNRYYRCTVCGTVQNQDYVQADGKSEVCTLPDFTGIKG